MADAQDLAAYHAFLINAELAEEGVNTLSIAESYLNLKVKL